MRVVSLVPSVTETLVDWGIAPVGVTRFCPPVPRAAVVGGTKDPDLARIAALRPDLVVVDEEENRHDDFRALRARGLTTLALAVTSLPSRDAALEALAEATGTPWAPVPRPAPPRPARRVAVVIWRRPWIFLGAPTYATSLLAQVGCANVLAGAGPYPRRELAAVALRRPDLLLAPSEPYPFGPRHEAELSAVAPVRRLDGRDLFWWGTRTDAALARLAATGW
ncbi:MAG: helical backbone metal receptor [Acidimicrobiales bacterium]